VGTGCWLCFEVGLDRRVMLDAHCYKNVNMDGITIIMILCLQHTTPLLLHCNISHICSFTSDVYMRLSPKSDLLSRQSHSRWMMRKVNLVPPDGLWTHRTKWSFSALYSESSI
jgi:hypothetical protein